MKVFDNNLSFATIKPTEIILKDFSKAEKLVFSDKLSDFAVEFFDNEIYNIEKKKEFEAVQHIRANQAEYIKKFALYTNGIDIRT